MSGRIFRSGLAAIHDPLPPQPNRQGRAFDRVDAAVTDLWTRGTLAA
jgi:hypothetical protein